MKNFKKILSGIMCLSLAGTAFSAFPKTEKINAQTAPQETVLGFKNGDINLDGKVDMIDLTTLSLRLLDEKVTFDLPDELSSMSSENVQQMINALSDIDSNEKTDLADLATLMQDIKAPSGRSKNKVVYSLPLSEDSATKTASSSSADDILIYCGSDTENRKYAIYNKNTHTVTLIGKGNMESDLHDEIYAVFSDYADEIKTIEVKSGITSVECISGLSVLTNIILPDTLTSIGKNSFSDCPLLSEINIPESVTQIKSGAFKNCPSLKKIYLPPKNITEIHSDAFDKDIVLCSEKGSYAEKYAKENNINFEANTEISTYPSDITELCQIQKCTGSYFNIYDDPQNDMYSGISKRTFLIRSMKELEELNLLLEDNGRSKHGGISPITQKLNVSDEFFREYALAVTVSHESSGSYELDLSSVELTSENEIIMKLHRHRPSPMDDVTLDMKSWGIAAAIPNKLLKENAQIKYEIEDIAERAASPSYICSSKGKTDVTDKCITASKNSPVSEKKRSEMSYKEQKEYYKLLDLYLDKYKIVNGEDQFETYNEEMNGIFTELKNSLYTSEKTEEFFSEYTLICLTNLEKNENFKNVLSYVTVDENNRINICFENTQTSYSEKEQYHLWTQIIAVPNSVFKGSYAPSLEFWGVKHQQAYLQQVQTV